LQDLFCAGALGGVEREEAAQRAIEDIWKVGAGALLVVEAGPACDLFAQLFEVLVVFVDAVSVNVWEPTETHEVDDHPEREDVGLGGKVTKGPIGTLTA
jgi:hypothetical protein